MLLSSTTAVTLFQCLSSLTRFQFIALILVALLVFGVWFWIVYSFSFGLKWNCLWMVNPLKGVFHFYSITFQNNKQPSGWLVHTCPDDKSKKYGGGRGVRRNSWCSAGKKVEQRARKQRWREHEWTQEQMNAGDASAICSKVGQPLDSTVAEDQIGIKVLWLTVWVQPPSF